MIATSIEHGIATVTLDRAQRRNAMSTDLVEAFIAFLGALRDNPEIRVVVVVGAGTGFCAGSDLAGLAGMDEAGRRQFEDRSGLLARMIMEAPVPVIAAVEGFAIGGGLTLATACDIVVTTPGARWSLPEVPIGLFPAWGLFSVIARIGTPKARRLSWGIDTLDGAEAHRIGLADVVSDTPRDEAMTIAASLADLPAAQVAAVKTFFSQDGTGEAADARANALFIEMTRTREAAASFERFAPRTPA